MAGMVGSIGAGQLVNLMTDISGGDIVLGYRYTLYVGIIFFSISLDTFFLYQIGQAIGRGEPDQSLNRPTKVTGQILYQNIYGQFFSRYGSRAGDSFF